MSNNLVLISTWVEHDEANGTGYYKEGCQIIVNGEVICLDLDPYDKTTVGDKIKRLCNALGVEARVVVTDKTIEI